MKREGVVEEQNLKIKRRCGTNEGGIAGVAAPAEQVAERGRDLLGGGDLGVDGVERDEFLQFGEEVDVER